MNLYRKLQREREKKISEYFEKYAFIAFDREQYEAGLKRLGLDEDAYLVEIPSMGGYVLAERAPEMVKILNSVKTGREYALADPETGAQFAFDMFQAELTDQGYGYKVGAEAWALDALDLTREDLESDAMLSEAFEKAKVAVLLQKRGG